jgi:long-chain acyl-CoA synthetase
MTVKTPLEMFYHWERKTPNKVFLRQPKALQWSEYTWQQIGDRARRVAAFLRAKDYPAGSRIALWAGNSMDWVIADLAIMMAGHISVPLYGGQDVASARYILEHSESRLIFLGNFDNAARADEALPAGIVRVGLLGATCRVDITLAEIIATTEPITDSPLPDPESIMTFVYTSGTTGNPKGVMHAHATPGHVVPELMRSLKQKDDGTASFMSFLPLSHIAERILVEVAAIYLNATVSFSEGLATFGDELRSVQPTFFFAVPRLWLKFKEAIDAKIPPAAQQGLNAEQKAGIARNLGLANASFVLTGSAPCPKDVQQWYIDMGIKLRDGYGMTENCIHGAAWISDEPPVPGCVGQPIDPNVQIRIGEGEEIQFKSPALMKGYYREPEKSAEVLVDGWYRTGDTGRIDEKGNLWITGRVSEVFKTSKGKFIRPLSLEDKFGACNLLGQFCVFGHGLDQPVVLASLSEVGKQLDRTELSKQLAAFLGSLNANLPAYERVPQIFITKNEWTITTGLLTPTMKLKRKTIEQHYRPWVESRTGKEPVVFE